MASTGFTASDTQADTEIDVGDVAWANLVNVEASDDSNANADGVANDGHTRRMELTNFGFAVPGGATIDGIQVRIEASADSGASTFLDQLVSLIKGGTVQGDNKFDVTQHWNATERTEDYPLNDSTSDLWGLTLSDTDVNASNFGVAWRTKRDGASSKNMLADYLAINVHYTAAGGPSGPPVGTLTMMGLGI